MLIGLINCFLQKYFDSDPEVARQLCELEGKNLILKLAGLKKEFLVTPRAGGVVVAEHRDDGSAEIAARVEADVTVLLRVALGARCQSMLDDGTLRVQGDPEPVRQMGSIFAAVDIDWEEVAAAYVGDLPAHQLGVWLRRTIEYKRHSLENFRLDVSEYLQEESRVMPARVEIERFLEDTEALDADIARFEARLRRLVQANRLS